MKHTGCRVTSAELREPLYRRSGAGAGGVKPFDAARNLGQESAHNDLNGMTYCIRVVHGRVVYVLPGVHQQVNLAGTCELYGKLCRSYRADRVPGFIRPSVAGHCNADIGAVVVSCERSVVGEIDHMWSCRVVPGTGRRTS